MTTYRYSNIDSNDSNNKTAIKETNNSFVFNRIITD